MCSLSLMGTHGPAKFTCRKNLTAWHGGDNLVQAVAAQNNNTIVIAHSVGPLILEPWIEHPNVTAVSSCILLCRRASIDDYNTGSLGRNRRAGSWKFACRCLIWCLESLWKASIYYCEATFRLSRTTYYRWLSKCHSKYQLH